MNIETEVNRVLKLIAQLSVDHASRSLSKMLKTGARIELERADIVNVSEASARVNQEDYEVTGSLVDLDGDINFKFLFFTNAEHSATLAELILGKKRNSIENFDVYAHSAIQELSNILSSAVANVFSQDLGVNLTTSPPMSIHDYLGAIFAEYVVTVAGQKSEILMIESRFVVVQHDVKCHMFILPVEDSYEAFARKFKSV